MCIRDRGQVPVRDEALIGGIVQDDGIVLPGVVHPDLQLVEMCIRDSNYTLNFLERGWNGENFHEVTENLRTSDPYMVMACLLYTSWVR